MDDGSCVGHVDGLSTYSRLPASRKGRRSGQSCRRRGRRLRPSGRVLAEQFALVAVGSTGYQLALVR